MRLRILAVRVRTPLFFRLTQLIPFLSFESLSRFLSFRLNVFIGDELLVFSL